MAKQVWKIEQFHGGLNSNSDPRDIAPNELSAATDVMVDELGKIRTMGGTADDHVAYNPTADGIIEPGYGLFQFSHDRLGGTVAGGNLNGTHTGGNNEAVELTDSAAAFTSQILGATLNNTTDGSSGTIATVASSTVLTVDDLTGGDGDFDSGDAYTITGFPETGDDYLAFADTDGDANLDIYSRVGDKWGGSVIDLGSVTGMKPTFYAVDGALRVSDGNFNNTNKWYGYIKREHFSDVTGYVDTYDGWYVKDQEIASPTTGIVGEQSLSVTGTTTAGDTTTLTDTTGSGAFNLLTAAQIDGKGYIAVNQTDDVAAVIEERDDDDSLGTASTTDWYNGGGSVYHIFPPAGGGFNVKEFGATSGGTWTAGTYELASTFIYDGKQESLPFVMSGQFILPTDKYPIVSVYLTSPFNPRITGGRIYYREKGSLDEWKLFLDMSLKEGIRPTFERSYNAWFEHGSYTGSDRGTYISTDPSALIKILNPDIVNTYEVLTGVNQENNSIYAEYKTAVVTNRIAYIGNVKTKNKDGDDEVFGDAMIKSTVNKFDVFPLSRIIEASVRDGDEIVKLEEYADRILQFKKKKMHLINISQELEFLEDTFIHKGVSHPAATCKTDFGIAWVNKLGCYLYDGQRVSNLLEKSGRQIIKESEWATFTANEPMIGYIPKKRQLIVVDDITTNGTGSTFLYDMVTQSWVRGAAATITDQNKTNFVTDWNGDLIYSHTEGTLLRWVDDLADATATTSSTYSVITKDIDFGQPGQRKKVYKVYITYISGGSNVPSVKYGVNGDATPTTVATSVTAIATGSSEWTQAEYTFGSDTNNCYSFRLKIVGSVDATFAINDISIVYRLKPVK